MNQRFMAFSGADTQIRTGDLILTKDALYRLSYISNRLLATGDTIALFPCLCNRKIFSGKNFSSISQMKVLECSDIAVRPVLSTQ